MPEVSAPGETVRRWAAQWVQHEPLPGASYAAALVVDDPTEPRWRVIARGLLGPLLGLTTYVVFTPVVVSALLGLSWLASGSPGTWTEYSRSAASFQLPAGMAATQLTLALLIPLSFALVLFVHRFDPRWLHSVQPGFRWRFGLACMLAGGIALVGVWVVSRIGQSWVFEPERDVWWFLLVILLTSPLQAAAEEYFFRGYLLQALHTAAPQGSFFGVVGSAAVFALLHGTQDIPLFVNRFAFGLLAGYLAVRTGGLEAGIAAHVVNNVVAFGYAALSGTMVELKGVQSVSWIDSAWSLGGYVAFTLVAVWIAARMRVATATPGVRFGARDEV
jgi:membrane protease YdiL (CAAX protease family)